ncbi:ABC transporter permease subunit [Dokdonella sp.]|uniref:ABC transporter permease/M1 family aminopeptidase n=1 Tax=Dokdonella sp. TaxID=2291710 RepID=UPI001B02E027|nr:ABC transporter permease subunit [Dokdonella sp.]MBO9662765.1 ABC transporter permease subunit [Dokdonella sp.]
MFLEILRFELRQQLRSPLFWMVALAFGAIAFAVAGSDSVQIGGGIGNVHRNAPLVVTQWLTYFTLFGLFLIPLFVANAALRDFETGTAELFFSTPMPRSAYLGGRFLAGYLAAIGILVVVAIGLGLGALMPWVDPERLGPTRLWTYLYAFAVFVLPGLFFLSAFLFLLATQTRSMLATYIGVVAFFVLWQIASIALGNLEHRTLGAMLDPFGLGAMDLATRYWSAEERNTRLPELSGTLLANRAMWAAIALLLLGAAFAWFRTERAGTGRRWWRSAAKKAVVQAADAPTVLARPIAIARTDATARFAQWRQLAWFDTRGVLGGVAFLVMLAFGLMNLGGSLAFSNELFGTKVYPVTHLMTRAMDGSYNFLLIIIVAFYAGELVWRERSHRISDVTDAFPLPDWIPLLSKLTALATVIVAFLAAGAVECVVYQLWRGDTPIEPGLYLSYIALTALGFLLFGALALFLQAISNNKFIGYLLVVVYFVVRIALGQLDYDHHLYNYGTAPAALYSDMNGYGHFLAGHLWFRAYWTCLAIALLVLAALYWVRGTARGWKERTRIARQRLTRPSAALLAAAVAGFAVLGGWIYYNTNVLNRYVPGDLAKQHKADYEKRYRQYLDLPQPKITDVRADVDIYPHQRRVDVRGHYVLANKGTRPIGDLHVRVPPEIKLVAVDFVPHEIVSDDRTQGYTIYRLKQPLAPGATMDFDFTLQYQSRGFRNAPEDTRVVDNGTFLDSSSFPHFGYDENGQLEDRNDRRKYDLPQRPRMPKIDDEPARQFNLLGRDADWVRFETTVSTVPEQIALAPGYLEKEWTADVPGHGPRRYFHYKMDQPILGFFSFQSARYEVRRDRWNDVAIEVYHDPKHAYNVERMVEATKKSLEHFSKAYTPFQFRQMRILEFPGYETFAQSFANTVPFSESIGFIADLRDPDDVDYVFYVTAHEVAHQWWAHQVIGALVQGVTMLDETFAQYSALMVQEREYGPSQMRKFLKYELDRYLGGRGGEVVEETPLGLVENQPYIHYRKGSVVMYALKDYLGEDLVDRVLAGYAREKAFQQPPYTTTREFLAELREAAGPSWSPLIGDLFDRITVHDNRVVEAVAKKRDDGKYDVTLSLHTGKVYSDGVGKETPAAFDQPVDIGVFARAADGKEAHQKVLFLEKRRVGDGDSHLTVTVDEPPYEAGIDPYNKLIDRVSEDNRKRITLQ